MVEGASVDTRMFDWGGVGLTKVQEVVAGSALCVETQQEDPAVRYCKASEVVRVWWL